MSYEEMKWMCEWQFVNGINFVCSHLEGYTIRGLRKRDYSAPVYEQSPGWKEYRLWQDYISRLGKLLADGDVDETRGAVHRELVRVERRAALE